MTKRTAKFVVGAIATVAAIGAAMPTLDFVPVSIATAYFDHLCRTQAKDVVYRPVDNVDGLLQMRPRDPKARELARYRFGTSDPYGYAMLDTDQSWRLFLSFDRQHYFEGYRAPRYRFVEGLDGAPGKTTRREAVATGRFKKVHPNVPDSPLFAEYELVEMTISAPTSRYGYTWEDVSNPLMRLLWIAGGRITVVDLQTKDVLAERVGFLFARRQNGSKGAYPWIYPENTCPKVSEDISAYVARVLRPTKDLEGDGRK